MNPKTSNKTKQFTRGGQITFHNIRMLLQVNKTVWNIYLFTLLILVVLIVYLITPDETQQNAWYWFLAQINPLLELLNFKISHFNVPYHGRIYSVSPKTYLSYSQFVKNAQAIIYYIKVGTSIGFILSLGIFYAIVKWLVIQGEKQTANQFIRGSKLDTTENVAKMIREQKRASDIVIDDMPIITNSETKHFLIHGTTGAGKTQLISKLLDQLRRRGDRVLLYDKGGIYTSTFFREDKDKILNPLDARCENWNLWHEARTKPDFENMAESLIPMHGEVDPFWVNSARTIFGSAAFTMQDDKDRSIKKLLKLLLTSELPDLHNYLARTEAATLASDKIEKTAISILSVITTYLKALNYMTIVEHSASKKPNFSIRDWICYGNNKGSNGNQKDDGWLFLSLQEEHRVALRPLLSMWFSMATIALLSLPEDINRRIWFVCDELPSLHRLPPLPGTIAEARKYGGCFILGMQSYAQLEEVYGTLASKGILDLLNTAFYFRSPSPYMAELVANALGTQEVEDMRENYSYGANTIRDGISIGSQRMTNHIVIPSEIMDMDEMKCYLRLAGSFPISLLGLAFKKRETIAKNFISSPINPDPEIECLIDEVDSKIKNFQVQKIPNIEQWQKSKTEQNNILEKTGPTDKNIDAKNPLQKSKQPLKIVKVNEI